MLSSDLNQFVLAEIARQLSARTPREWSVDGDRVIGGGNQAVVLGEHDGQGPAHVDFGFVLNRDDESVPVIWDCTAGYGATEREILTRAVDSWCSCTAPAVIELLAQNGEYAEHYTGRDPQGLAGWHVIHGPIFAFGHGNGPEVMQRWVIDHPLLPKLDGALVAAFDRPVLNGVKVLFGGDVAEVRVNGEYAEGASKALAALPWPRLEPVAFARCFLLAVGPE
jgi:hypothetical protein